MVWYIPPLSPVVDVLRDTGHDAEAAPNLFGAIDALRIPLSYLAGLFTAGEVGSVRDVLARLAAMRSFMRDINLGREPYRRHAWRPNVGFLGIDGQYVLVTMCGDEDFGSESDHLVGISGPCKSREFFGCGVQCNDTAGIVVFITGLG